MAWRMDAMIRKCPCLRPEVEEIRMLDFKHCSLADVPNEIFNFERTLEELHLDANQIHDLPRALFHCHELRILGLGDNDIHSLPQAIASLINLEELDISKNGVLDIPDNIKGCKCLRILEASVNPLGKLPDGFTQLINLEELYLNDTFVDFLPANFGRLTKLRILELRENHLKSLPKSMARLTELTRLDIGQNDFREMPDVIGSLPKLSELWCDCNRISLVPPFIGNLRRLTYLEVSRNRIESLPNEIESCVNLTDVTLSSNSLKTLPETIGCLINLSTLRIDDNRLVKLPNSIGCLSNLEECVLSQNDLKFLPASIGLLRKMHTLIVDDNLLEYLPPEIGSCGSLTILSARCNRLTAVPDELGHIPQLRIVNLGDNRIAFLPFSVTKLRNLQALWLSENQNKPLIPLQSDIDIDTGQRVLTCFILPQVHQKHCEDPISDTESLRLSVWEEQRPQRQHIKFAFDEKLDKPGKLLRNPTPYPKELKSHAKHARNNQAIKTKSANYANIDSLQDDEANLNNDLEAAIVQETAVWLPSMPVAVKEARVTKPKSPHRSPKLNCTPSDEKFDKENIYIKQARKPPTGQSGSRRTSSDSSAADVGQVRERSNSVKDFLAAPAINRAIGSPVTVGKFASLPELSAPCTPSKKPIQPGGRCTAAKETKHQRSYSSGILRKLESLKQGRHHKYEGLKNSSAASRSDQDLCPNPREGQFGAGPEESPASGSVDGYASDWEAVVARRYGNVGNSAMTFGQAKRPASISAAHTRPVAGGWHAAQSKAALAGSYGRSVGGGGVSSGTPDDGSRTDCGKGSNIRFGMITSPRPPPDLLPRSSGQCNTAFGGGMREPAASGGPHGQPLLQEYGRAPPPMLPPRFRPQVQSLPPSSNAIVGTQLVYARHPSGAGTVPPSPNRNRKPPPYHIAATYSRQIGDPLSNSHSSEVVGHPYARPSNGPPSPRGYGFVPFRYDAPRDDPNVSGPLFPVQRHHGQVATPPRVRSATPPFPLSHSPAGRLPSPQRCPGDGRGVSPPESSSGPSRSRNAVVDGAVVYNNPYIYEQPLRTNRSPSPSSNGSHRSGRSSGDRVSVDSKRSPSSSIRCQQSPHRESSIPRMSPKMSPAGTPPSSASSNSSCDVLRKPLTPLNVSGAAFSRSLSAPSTPPPAADYPSSSPPVPPYRTPPIYQSHSIGNLDAIGGNGQYSKPPREQSPARAGRSPVSRPLSHENDGERCPPSDSPPNLLKKCRISLEQRSPPVAPQSYYANTQNVDSPSYVNGDGSRFGWNGSRSNDRVGQTTPGTSPRGSSSFPSHSPKFDTGDGYADSQSSPGSCARLPPWLHAVGSNSDVARSPSSPECVDPSRYGIFKALPVLVDSGGSRDEASASEYDVETKPRSRIPTAASMQHYVQSGSNGATVFSNPYAGGVAQTNRPPNLTQDKVIPRGGSAALVVPTPQRPAPAAVAQGHVGPLQQSAQREEDVAWTRQASSSDLDGGFTDQHVLLLKKQSPWLFGQHHNPKVIPVVIQKNPDLGFDIVQYQNGSPPPFESAICVATVTPEGAASTVLKPGDKLLQVDGKDISRLDLSQARRVLRETGSTVFMMVSR